MRRGVLALLLVPALLQAQEQPPGPFVPRQTPRLLPQREAGPGDLPVPAPPALLLRQSGPLAPASFHESDLPSAAENLARQLVQRRAVDAESTRPLTLRDALHGAPPRERRAAVAAYWQLWRAAAGLTTARQRRAILAPLAADAGAADELALVQLETDVLLAKAELRLLEAQQALFAARAVGTEPLPWPVDTAWTGTYHTRLERIYQQADPPAELRQLDRRLPLLLRVLRLEADVTLRSWADVQRAQQMYLEGTLELPGLLERLQRWWQAAEQFADSTQRYNLAIAEYALQVGGHLESVDRVAAMLLPAGRPGRDRSAETTAAALLPVSR